MLFESVVLSVSEDFGYFAIWIVKVSKDANFCWTSRLTSSGRLSMNQAGIRTEVAFVYRVCPVVDIACIIGACLHTVGTQDTLVRIDTNDPVFIIIGRIGRTDLLTGSVVTLLTLARLKTA